MFKNKIVWIGFFLIVASVLFFCFERNVDNVTENETRLTKKNKNFGELKIGYITDLHCYSKLEKDTNTWEPNWRCSQPLGNFIKMMNEEFHPGVVVDGGDLIDGRDGQGENLYPAVLEMFDKITSVPHYHVIGNHETRNFIKDDWRSFAGYNQNYYYQDINKHLLIVLDGNLKLNEHGNDVDTSPELEYYPGYLGVKQTAWLEDVLKSSEDKNILVFVHQPPIEKPLVKKEKDLFVKGGELRKMFSEYGVSAVFSGHIEETCYIEEDGVKYYVLEGAYKENRQLLEEDYYKDKGVIYEIVVNNQGDPEVKMFYRDKEATEYETLIIDNKTAICNNESIQHPEVYEALVNEQMDNKEEDKE